MSITITVLEKSLAAWYFIKTTDPIVKCVSPPLHWYSTVAEGVAEGAGCLWMGSSLIKTQWGMGLNLSSGVS